MKKIILQLIINIIQDDVDGIGTRQSKELEKADITTKLSWIAFQDQFFSSVLISNDYFLNASLYLYNAP